jgi:hypothetical protein
MSRLSVSCDRVPLSRASRPRHSPVSFMYDRLDCQFGLPKCIQADRSSRSTIRLGGLPTYGTYTGDPFPVT